MTNGAPARSTRARLLGAGFGPGGARTMYGLGLVSAAKGAALVVMAGAVASGIVSVIHGSTAWHQALTWGLVAALARGILAWVGRVASARAALGAKEQLRAELADAFVSGGARSPGSDVALATRDLDELDEYYGSVLPALTNAAVIPLIVGARILFSDWVSALVIVLTIPLVPLFMALIGMYTKDAIRDATHALGRLSDHLVELARGLPVLVGLGRVEEQAAALEELSSEYRTRTVRTLRTAFLSSLVLEMISTISVAVVAVFIGLRLVNGSLPLETGLLVLILVPECFAPFRQLGAAFHASQNGVEALGRARDIIGFASERAAARHSGPDLSSTGTPAVLVDQLTVRYPDRSRPAVVDLSFSLARGTTSAVVGPSGAGKTTVLRFLAERLADGVDGAQVSGRLSIDPQGRTAWLPQHPAMSGETVLEELRSYGEDIPVELLETRVAELAAQFGLNGLLGDAPAQLSPGELRRVAFARALLRVEAGAELLLLDEPTAHLDPDNASRVRAAIASLRGRVTIVLASHDPDVVGLAEDHILVGEDTAGLAGRRDPGRALADESPVLGDRAGRPQEHPVRLGTALRLLADFLRPACGRMAAAVLLGAGAALFSVALTALSGWLIVRASQEPNVMLLLVAIVGVRFFGIGRAVLHYAEALVTHDAVFASIGSLRMRLWAALAGRGASVRRLLTGGTTMDYLVLTADRIRDLAPRVVLPIGAGILTSVGALVAVALLYAPAVPLVACCLLVCILVAPPLAAMADRHAAREQAELRSTVGRRFTALISAADDLRANGVDRGVRAELARLDLEAGARARRGAWAVGAGHAVVIAVCCATSVAILPICLPAVQAGTLPTEIVGVLALLPLGLIEPLLLVVEAVQLWPALAQSLARAGELGLRQSRARGRREAGARERHSLAGARATTSAGGVPPSAGPVSRLSIRGLSARWPEATEPAFSGADAELRRGEWLVVAGPSGSGKSTFLTVLLGYLPAAAGTFLLDGADVRDLDRRELRTHLAWAPQEGHLFDSTIRGNLLLARSHDDRPSDGELFAVLERVGLGFRLLESLPGGLDTRVGPRGSYLSGGQRQRLAVARTLLTRADVILLDEPTAHLDEDSAARLMADLRAATSDKITVLVTHHAAELETGDRSIEFPPRPSQRSSRGAAART